MDNFNLAEHLFLHFEIHLQCVLTKFFKTWQAELEIFFKKNEETISMTSTMDYVLLFGTGVLRSGVSARIFKFSSILTGNN